MVAAKQGQLYELCGEMLVYFLVGTCPCRMTEVTPHRLPVNKDQLGLESDSALVLPLLRRRLEKLL